MSRKNVINCVPSRLRILISPWASAIVLEYDEVLCTFAKHQNKPSPLLTPLDHFHFHLNLALRSLNYNSATIQNAKSCCQSFKKRWTCFWPLVSLGEDERRRKARKMILSHLLISNIISGCLRRDWWFDTDHGAKLCWATKAFNKEGGECTPSEDWRTTERGWCCAKRWCNHRKCTLQTSSSVI